MTTASRCELAARTHQGLESAVAVRLEKQHFRGCAGAVAGPQQPRAEHTRGIEDQHITGGDRMPEIAKHPVLDRASGPIQHH